MYTYVQYLRTCTPTDDMDPADGTKYKRGIFHLDRDVVVKVGSAVHGARDEYQPELKRV